MSWHGAAVFYEEQNSGIESEGENELLYRGFSKKNYNTVAMDKYNLSLFFIEQIVGNDTKQDTVETVSLIDALVQTET